MIAAEDVTLYRTAGDTSPLLVTLQLQTSSGTANASDSATAVLESGGVEITGTGLGSGVFSFAVATLPDVVGTARHDIKVTQGGQTDVWARGSIITAAKL
jgi:hypothetical protein